MSLNIPSFLKNKYLIALVVVLIWMAFFDNNNMIYQLRLRKQLHELQDDKEFFLHEINRDSTSIRELRDNPEALERFAREKYLMKKSGEDIFVIKEE